MIKLVYFNIKGYAETSRILLALAQVKYTDYRFPLEMNDGEFKKEEFEKVKNSGVFDTSMGKVPLLELTDKKGNVAIIPQSKAIERYLSKRFGFMGSNDIEAARIDAVCECIRDIKDRYNKIPDDKKDEYFKGNLKTELEAIVKVFDKSKKLSIGDKLSLADVTIYTLITQFFDQRAMPIAGNIDRLREIIMAVAGRPEVRIWISERPDTPF